MESTPTTVAPPVETAAPPVETPAPQPPPFDLWMLAALSFLPLTLLFIFSPDVPGETRTAGIIFIAGMVVDCMRRRSRGHPLNSAWRTGAWLLPAIVFAFAIVETVAGARGPNLFNEIICSGIGFAMVGIVLGAVTAKQVEAVLVLGSLFRRTKGRTARLGPAQSVRERLDEVSTPLDAPPAFGLPRRFGIRGLLIVTTWAAVLMGFLRSRNADANTYFLVVTFVAGTLAAQVLVFEGRKPIKASAWAGAFLLPALTAALVLWNWHQVMGNRPQQNLAETCALFGCLVPAGIALGTVAGGVFGGLYVGSESFLVWLAGGPPEIELRPVAEDDAEVILGWILGPNLCRRWAGDQLTWPLDRRQLLARFAAAGGEHPARRAYKAVDADTGDVLGYVELGRIDYLARRAWLELPLLDPSAPERARLGVRLIEAVAHRGFSLLGLATIIVAAESEQAELALCCQEAFRTSTEFYAMADKGNMGWIARIGAIPKTA